MLLPKITIYQLQDFHLSSRYQNENANRIIFIQHIVTHDACMRSQDLGLHPRDTSMTSRDHMMTSRDLENR